MGILRPLIVNNGICSKILLSILLNNLLTRSVDEHIGQSSTVSTHVGNQTLFAIADINSFIQFLGNRHRALGRKRKLCTCFLLQGGSDKRWTWRTAAFGGADGRNRKVSLTSFHDGFCLFFIFQADLFSIDFGKGGIECFSILIENTINGPVFLWYKSIDFLFSFHDQFECHRLNSSCGFGTDFGFEQFGKTETNDTVQNSSCLLRMHQIHINGTWLCKCFLYCIFCDFMEGNTVYCIF